MPREDAFAEDGLTHSPNGPFSPESLPYPRVHDLRHSFAVATLLRWYREGIDPNCRLMSLSTFLGHVDPDSTAVYLTITEDLLHEAAQRFHVMAPKGGMQ